MSAKSGTPSKLKIFRMLTLIVGHGNAMISIYVLFQITVLLIATTRIEHEAYVLSTTTKVTMNTEDTTQKFSTTATMASNQKEEDNKESYWLYFNTTNPGVTFDQAGIIYVVASFLNVPRLYAGLKLVQAANLKRNPGTSIALAFLYAKIQFIATAAELLTVGFIFNLTSDNFWNNHTRHLWYILMQNVLCQLVFIFTVAAFIYELLKSNCKIKGKVRNIFDGPYEITYNGVAGLEMTENMAMSSKDTLPTVIEASVVIV